MKIVENKLQFSDTFHKIVNSQKQRQDGTTLKLLLDRPCPGGGAQTKKLMTN
jgi:hypothetical protein